MTVLDLICLTVSGYRLARDVELWNRKKAACLNTRFPSVFKCRISTAWHVRPDSTFGTMYFPRFSFPWQKEPCQCIRLDRHSDTMKLLWYDLQPDSKNTNIVSLAGSFHLQPNRNICTSSVDHGVVLQAAIFQNLGWVNNKIAAADGHSLAI